MNEIERLGAIEEIKQIKARYIECLDGKNWSEYEKVFTPDAVMDSRLAFSATDPVTGASRIFGKPKLLATMDTSNWVTTGAKAIATNAAALLGPVCTVHKVYLPRITIVSDEVAEGIWGMEDLLRFPDGSEIAEINGFGNYHERYQRFEGRWLINRSQLLRLRIDVR